MSPFHSGQLVLRRDKAELICAVAEGAQNPLREWFRLPFPEGTFRQVRLYAAPTAVNVRIGKIRIRAEEVTGGFPRREQPNTMPWWSYIAGFFFVVAVALLVVRRRNVLAD
jgi:hypothetical protein